MSLSDNNSSASSSGDEGDRFTPSNPCLRSILKLFSDEKTADAVFEVNGQEKFYAHRLILQTCAPALAEYFDFDDAKDGGMASAPIHGVNADLFRHMLYYVYGGSVPDKIFSEKCKDIIDIADRFGVGNLKVEAEGWYVKSTPITLDNFVENLYFSDTKKCALLKEKVMDFLVQNEIPALDKLAKVDVPQSESMLTDFLTASARKKRQERNDYQLKTMSINSLRRNLDRRGLDVDGTREILVSTLQGCYSAEGAVVEGAGTPQVNGFYKQSGNFDGAPMYRKSATYQGEKIKFTLFRCSLTDRSRRWYISIVPDDIDPGTTRDRDFYCAVGSIDEMTPPRDFSMTASIGGGALPPPKVSVKSQMLGDGE
eukprot:CAMPEP_0183706746 /NCGR_PEP_ID=MMETSP0737-20130205/3501_1 /TAXON_ID=385413 /ORGANISM="Thalassiosira miniscula, Strain CCMP1093" /LENGTH=368 /DNA_ID=CAMNT_0025934241 /DNA_START=164 /DNA_END=1270 /DNA_ORIENTATION=+